MIYWPSRYGYKAYADILQKVATHRTFRIPSAGPVIIFANHVSQADPYIIASAHPWHRTIHFLAKVELFSLRKWYGRCREDGHSRVVAFIRALLTYVLVRFASTIPVDPENRNPKINKRALKRCHAILREGKCLGMFFQGGIGRESVSRLAFDLLEKHPNASIVPVCINNRQKQIRVWVFHPIDGAELQRSPFSNQELAERLAALIRTFERLP